MAVGLAIAEDEHADGDQHKGEQGADVGQVGDGADVKQAGGNADDESRDPGGESRGAELGVDAAEDAGQQAVAGHGEPDAGLAELKDEDGRDHAQQRADENDQAHPVQHGAAGAAGCSRLSALTTGAASPITDLPGHNAAEHDGDAAVEHGAGDQRGQNAEGQVALRIAALFGGRRNRVEPDVGEEDDGAAGQARPTSRWA